MNSNLYLGPNYQTTLATP